MSFCDSFANGLDKLKIQCIVPLEHQKAMERIKHPFKLEIGAGIMFSDRSCKTAKMRFMRMIISKNDWVSIFILKFLNEWFLTEQFGISKMQFSIYAQMWFLSWLLEFLDEKIQPLGRVLHLHFWRLCLWCSHCHSSLACGLFNIHLHFWSTEIRRNLAKMRQFSVLKLLRQIRWLSSLLIVCFVIVQWLTFPCHPNLRIWYLQHWPVPSDGQLEKPLDESAVSAVENKQVWVCEFVHVSLEEVLLPVDLPEYRRPRWSSLCRKLTMHNNADILAEIGLVELEELFAVNEIFGADNMTALEFVTEARVKDDDPSEWSLLIRSKEVCECFSGNAGNAASWALEHWDGIPRIAYFCGTKFLRIGKIRQRETKAFHQHSNGFESLNIVARQWRREFSQFLLVSRW